MIDKEIAELRRRLTPEKHNISAIYVRYVNTHHETIASFTTPFFLLGQEDGEKYLSIFRHVLSGTNNKNLIDIAFSMGQVENSEEHRLLETLRQSSLKDEEAVNAFFDKIVPTTSTEYNTAIFLMTDTYDVPIRQRDEGGLGESDSMFRYILCAVCPVKEEKPAFTFDPSKNCFRTRSCDWNVAPPELGFVYPAFDGRQTNIYNALYYTKNLSDSHEEFTDAIFKTELPLPADEQKAIFDTLLSDTLGDECRYDVVQAIHDDIAQKIDEHKALHTPEPLTVNKRDLCEVLSSCGVSEEKRNDFMKSCDEKYGTGADLPPANIVESKRLEVKTPDVQIKVTPERGDLIETRVIDGVKYLLIRADESVTVNGVEIAIS